METIFVLVVLAGLLEFGRQSRGGINHGTMVNPRVRTRAGQVTVARLLLHMQMNPFYIFSGSPMPRQKLMGYMC